MTVWLTSRGRLQTGPAELSAGLRYTTSSWRTAWSPLKMTPARWSWTKR